MPYNPQMRPLFPIVAQTCSKMIEYIDKHLQASSDGFDAKDVSLLFLILLLNAQMKMLSSSS